MNLPEIKKNFSYVCFECGNFIVFKTDEEINTYIEMADFINEGNDTFIMYCFECMKEEFGDIMLSNEISTTDLDLLRALYQHTFICNECDIHFQICDEVELERYLELTDLNIQDLFDEMDDVLSAKYMSELRCFKCLIEKEKNNQINKIVSTFCSNLSDNELIDSDENDNYWSTEIKIVKECSEVPTSIDVLISPLCKVKIDFLMRRFERLEWLAYFIGEVKNNKFYAYDIYIPKQTVTSGNVYNVDSQIPQGINVIGVIHSHHHMGTFFSGTDHEYINQNHNLSIVISKDKMMGQARWSTPCGRLKIVDTNIQIDYGVDFDIKEFSEIINEKINEPSKLNKQVRQYQKPYYKMFYNRQEVKKETRDILSLDDEMKEMEEQGMIRILS